MSAASRFSRFFQEDSFQTKKDLDRANARIQELENSLADSEKQNLTLRNATQALLDENIAIKDRMEITDKTAPEVEELRHLLHLLEVENVDMVDHLRKEKLSWLQIKELHGRELFRLQQNLSQSEADREALTKILTATNSKLDAAKTRIQILQDEIKANKLMETKRSGLEKAETLLNELRDAYHSQLAALTAQLNKSQEQLRRVSLKSSQLESEVIRLEGRCSELTNQRTGLQTENSLQQSRIAGLLTAKKDAERLLAQFVQLHDSKQAQISKKE